MRKEEAPESSAAEVAVVLRGFAYGLSVLRLRALRGTCMYVLRVGVEEGDEIRKAEKCSVSPSPIHTLWYPYPVQVSRNEKLRSLLI